VNLLRFIVRPPSSGRTLTPRGGNIQWQVIAKAYGADWSGMIGYRALYADYSKGSGNTLYQFDMLQHGPIVGVSARF
jgi:hypothetical protein